MSKAAKAHTPPRVEPEEVAAQVRDMLAPFFRRRPDGGVAADAVAPPLKPAPRAAVEDLIEAAFELLDSLDGDADFEPSLGSVATAVFTSQLHWAGGDNAAAADDREQACDDEGHLESEAVYHYGVDQTRALQEYC